MLLKGSSGISEHAAPRSRIDPSSRTGYHHVSVGLKGEARLRFRIGLDREEDGRWIAEIASLPGVMAYGKTKQEAVARVKALALRVLADKVEKEKNHSTKPLAVSIACSR